MPFYLKESDILPRVAGFQSVLIVPCYFCPAASLAVRKSKPYIRFFRNLLKTEAYESFIKELKSRLEDEGLRTAVFDSKMPYHYAACMWTARRRSKLAERAAEFDALLVLGCEATVELVRDSVKHDDSQVILGMDNEGLMNVLPALSFPCNVTLELNGVTPVVTKTQ